MKRIQLYVSSIGEDCCESARDFGVGIELAQFCTAARLDGAPPEPWECPLDRCLAAADRFVLHGPFNELTPAAIDPMVLRVTETRYRQAIEKARELHAPKLVLHAGFLPLVYDPEWFVERSVSFWQRLIREVPEGLTVCLENVLEPEAALLTQIVRDVDDRFASASILATRTRSRPRSRRRRGCARARHSFLMYTCITTRAAATCTRRSWMEKWTAPRCCACSRSSRRRRPAPSSSCRIARAFAGSKNRSYWSDRL